MHAGELVQLAALVATHGPCLLHGGGQLSGIGLQRYWTASKCRLDRWSRALAEYSSTAPSELPRYRWKAIRPVVEEILLSEVLVRVWTAVLVAHDRYSGQTEAEPIARSVLTGQMEARHRALKLLMHAPGVRIADAVELNRLRRKSERWTDLLLARLAQNCTIEELAIDPERAVAFANDLQHESDQGQGEISWPILLSSLQASFEVKPRGKSPNCDLNERIAASILACFPPGLFDSTGQFRSLLMARIRYVAEDAQCLLDELWSLERPLAVSDRSVAEDDLEERLRRQ
jgi:hypothetical protein